MRDHFEHIDERIERWAKDPSVNIHVDMNVTPAPLAHDVPQLAIFRNLDPQSWRLVFWGDTFEVKAIIACWNGSTH